MARLGALLACLALLTCLQSGAEARRPPKYPDAYEVSYTYSLPHADPTGATPSRGVSYPVRFWLDGPGRRVRMDTYAGSNVILAKNEKQYALVPRIDEQVCFLFDDALARTSADNMRALPDLAGWEDGGDAELDGRPARLWTHSHKREGKAIEYRFWSGAEDGAPLRLHMTGPEILTGGAFGEWVADYTSYSPGRPEAVVFDTPELCDRPLRQGEAGAPAGPGPVLRAAAALPRVAYGGDAQYDGFLAAHGAGRSHASLQEYRMRAALHRGNARMIEAHNAAGHSYTLAMNRFGDWTREEFLALMLPKAWARQQRQRAASQPTPAGAAADAHAGAAGAASGKAPIGGPNLGELQRAGRLARGKYELPYEPLADPARLPRDVGWVGTGAVPPVKMQANCGGCWSFGAAGAMEGAWFVATGQAASFAEQQVLDCAWDFAPSNMACDGGSPWAGVGHIAEAGGIALNKDYPFLGQDGFCAANRTRLVGRFKGYVRLPMYDDDALREALFSRGPIGISIDASLDTFTFYSSGVYNDPRCQYRYDDLDHAVVLVGYGTTAAGEDYWLVRNSWSELWGDQGYVKISRDAHGCGAATDGLYAVVADDVAAGSPRLRGAVGGAGAFVGAVATA